MSYIGTRWYKCDFHLHTTSSRCFQDQTVNAEQWVQRAIEQGLDCVAVTDHNTGSGIDSIKKAAEGTKLVVFPGVEITCDTSKIHILVLFDVTNSSDHVRDFLNKLDISTSQFGEQDACTSKSIFDVAKIAYRQNCLIIPAHIDEYNGLSKVSYDNLKKFYELEYINAVHVIHKDFLDPNLQTVENEQLKSYLNTYYSNPKPSIDDTTVKSWHIPVKLVLVKK